MNSVTLPLSASGVSAESSGGLCQRLQCSLFGQADVWIQRDDLLHPLISGNKFRKLQFPLAQLPSGAHVISMGGPWSNHLHALGYALQQKGIPGTVLIRGGAWQQTAMQADLQRWGIRIQYADRETYRRLREPDYWRQCVPDAGAQAVWLPEGGSDPSALHGVAQMVRELPFVPDTIVTAVGTGATLAGIMAGMAGRGRVIGVAAFQGADYLHQEIARLLQAAGYPAYQNYQLLTDAHHGGFARMTPALIADAQCFVRETGIPLEPVYTGKLVSAVAALVQQGTIRAGECLLLLHTGGLQGLRGIRRDSGWPGALA